jgi:hypothetical protein
VFAFTEFARRALVRARQIAIASGKSSSRVSAVQAESPSTREQELEALVSHMRHELAVTSEQLADVITERDSV